MIIICRKPRPSRQSWLSRGHRDGKSAQFISFKAASETSFDDGWNSCAQNQTTSTKFGQAVVEQHQGQFEFKYCQRDQLQLLGSLSQRKLGVTIRACPPFWEETTASGNKFLVNISTTPADHTKRQVSKCQKESHIFCCNKKLWCKQIYEFYTRFTSRVYVIILWSICNTV